MAERDQLVDIQMNGNKIVGLPNGVDDAEPATMAQLRAQSEGLAWKDNVRVAATVNVTLSGPGSAINGITLSNGDRVLLPAQTTVPDNGIYIFNGSGSAMTRATDASTGAELESAVVTVDEGSGTAGVTYRQTQANFTIGSGDNIWEVFGSTVPDASETVKGKIELATQGEVDTGTDTVRGMTPAAAKAASWRVKKYDADIGDNSATAITVTHNLGSRAVMSQVMRNSDYEIVDCLIENLTTNTTRFTFNTAPTSNQFHVTIVG